MENANTVQFLLTGRYALFSDPVTRVGGEKCSYLAPTYEAIKGVCESIYWKPTFVWVVDRVRVLAPIQSQSKGVRPISLQSDPSTLSIYTYLRDVRYHVEAHFEWNERRTDLAGDRNENKHYFMAKRSVEKGGRRDIFLGTRECQGYVEPCAFDEGIGAYDDGGEMSFGLQFHGFTYADEGDGRLVARFWYPKMEKGVIAFCRPEQCPVQRALHKQVVQPFTLGQNLRPVEEEWEEAQP